MLYSIYVQHRRRIRNGWFTPSTFPTLRRWKLLVLMIRFLLVILRKILLNLLSVHVQNVSLGGGAKLDLGVPPQIQDLHLDFTFESLTVLFENLLGGGSLETLIETTINLLGKLKYFHN